MKPTSVLTLLGTSALTALALVSGCHQSCPGDTTGIVQGDQFRITVLSQTSTSQSCAAPSLPTGTSFVVVAGPAEPVGPPEACAPDIHAAQAVIPALPFDSAELTACVAPGSEGGGLGFTCSGAETSGCQISAYVQFQETAAVGAPIVAGLGSMSVSWILSACGQAQCDQYYSVQIDPLGLDGGVVSDAASGGG
jgi:hypothetical protein